MLKIFEWGKKKPPMRLEKKCISINVENEILKAKENEEKIYLVLTGGGACGRWQVGVLAFLEQIGLLKHINGIVGTSVGALNGMLTAKNIDTFDNVITLWENITDNKDMYKGEIKGGFGGLMAIIGQLFKDNGGKSVLKPEGLYKLLDNEFSKYKLIDFKVDTVTTSTDLTDDEGRCYVAENCNMPCNLLGKMTSAIPVAFPAVIDDKGHINCDGGWGNNSPVRTAIVERGATKVLVIGTSTKPEGLKGQKIDIFNIIPAIIQFAMNKFERDMYDKIKAIEKDNNISVEMLRIYPVKSTGSALEFGNCEQLQAGYDFACETITYEVLRDFLS